MHVNRSCNVLCSKQYDQHAVKKFVARVSEDYSINWIVDNLPAATTGITRDNSVLYSRGFPLGGRAQDGSYYIYNHVRITLKYHSSEEYDGKRIVGFDVHPMSVRHALKEDGTLAHCDATKGISPTDVHDHMFITGPDATATTKVTWSYDVFWVPSNVRWASRWDIYLSMGNRFSSDIHWWSIVNSTVGVRPTCVAVVVAVCISLSLPLCT